MEPGNFQVECGSNRAEEDDTYMINAKNGNIDIIATNGKIRLQANDIELVAFHGETTKGNIKMVASESIVVKQKRYYYLPKIIPRSCHLVLLSVLVIVA